MMIEVADRFVTVVLQPTTLCNLDCRYCYLPLRRLSNRMPVAVAAAVARAIEEQNHDRPVSILWHGGEPLACGIAHFRDLLHPFEELRLAGRIVHVVQTNATLVNDEWCELFCAFGFHVGASVDGPVWMTDQRTRITK
jgi:uncharacterized protein